MVDENEDTPVNQPGTLLQCFDVAVVLQIENRFELVRTSGIWKTYIQYRKKLTWSCCCRCNHASDSYFQGPNSSSAAEFQRPKYPKARSNSFYRWAAWPASKSTNTISIACTCRTRKSIYPCDRPFQPILARTVRFMSTKRKITKTTTTI